MEPLYRKGDLLILSNSYDHDDLIVPDYGLIVDVAWIGDSIYYEIMALSGNHTGEVRLIDYRRIDVLSIKVA